MADGIFLFISGFSGTGKTTLVHECAPLFPEYIFQDFDEFFFGPDGEWGIEDGPEGFLFMQQRIDAFIRAQEKPIVLAGVNMLGNTLNAQYQVVLDTPLWQVVRNLWQRARDAGKLSGMYKGEKRWRSVLGGYYAWKMRRHLVRQGFILMTRGEIIGFLMEKTIQRI